MRFGICFFFVLFISIFLVTLTPKARAGDIDVIFADYGDQDAGQTCTAAGVEGLCDGRSICEFSVTDDLCSVASDKKVLRVIYNCGPPTDNQTIDARRGTRMSINCQ